MRSIEQPGNYRIDPTHAAALRLLDDADDWWLPSQARAALEQLRDVLDPPA